MAALSQAKLKHHLEVDFFAILLSIAVTVWLVQSGIVGGFLAATSTFKVLETFLAGTLFTSAFTTPVAIGFLAEIARASSVLQTALIGAAGAVCGDLVIFKFVRDRLAEDIFGLLGKKGSHRLLHIFHKRIFHWLSPFIAAMIFASPLPDELGVMLLGFVHTKTVMFLPYSYVANFIGILIIGLLARAFPS